jgi:hypothetical protein
MMKWKGRVAHMGETCNSYKLLAGRPEGKRPHERSRRRWDDVTTNLKEIGCDAMDLFKLSRYKDEWRNHVNMGLIKCGNFLTS